MDEEGTLTVSGNDPHQRAGEFWTKVSLANTSHKRHWWHSEQVIRYINSLVSSEKQELNPAQLHHAFHQRLRFELGGRAHHAISIGCGEASKELGLLHAGVVDHFDLYDLSEERLRRGRLRAEELGLSGRANFTLGDAVHRNKTYDLVYWNNSLHHMLDVERAIAQSKERLVDNGLFAMDDFVGPARFQWTDRALDYVNSFRAALPDFYFRNPDDPNTNIPRVVERPSIEDMIATDPTEAAQSDLILPALRRYFHSAAIIPTGGSLYVLAFKEILANFDESNDAGFLKTGILIDRALNEMGEFCYAVAFSRI